MSKDCNLNLFFNAFTANFERTFCCLGKYNGFYSPRTYRKHLDTMLKKYKHDMLYGLPFQNECDKIIYISNINQELCRLKKQLATKLLISRQKNQNHGHRISKNIQIKLDKLNYRRVLYMRYRQYRYINKALEVTRQAAENYQINLLNSQETRKTSYVASWNGNYLEFMQLCYALIHAQKINVLQKDDVVISKLAKVFGLKEPKSKDTTLSHALHSRNRDYEPAIFKDIRSGYKHFEQLRREKASNREGSQSRKYV